ncbi:MAG: hypothetical protein KDD70_03355 [Bdellovibrionales bacterium]|nr:hypothetical protein [Bdellovibrionales bacterium]
MKESRYSNCPVSIVWPLFFFFLLILGGCSANTSPVRPVTDGNISIYVETQGENPKASLKNFFNSNVVIVAQVAERESEGEMKYEVDYPSINSGPSPMYSHQVQIEVADNVPLSIEELMEKKMLGVFTGSPSERRWKLIGFVANTGQRDSLDWFVQHPELRYTK